MPSKVIYELRSCGASCDPMYLEALQVYINEIPAALRCNSNEITYWLSRYNTRHAPDRLHVFALVKCTVTPTGRFYRSTLVKEEVIGFTQYAALIQEQLVIIDYLAIAKSHRREVGSKPFFAMQNQLRNHVAQHYDGFQIVTECMDTSGPVLLELLKRAGFAVAPYGYKQPAMRRGQREESGKLLIFPPILVLPSEYRRISQAIAVKHYQRWQSFHEVTLTA
jgi:hypothetical protein